MSLGITEVRRGDIAFCCCDPISRRPVGAWHPALRGFLAARHVRADWLHSGMGPSPNSPAGMIAQASRRVSYTQIVSTAPPRRAGELSKVSMTRIVTRRG